MIEALDPAEEREGRRHLASNWTYCFLNSGRRLLLFRVGAVRPGEVLSPDQATRVLRLITAHGVPRVREAFARAQEGAA